MLFRSYRERRRAQEDCLRDRNCLALLDWLSVAPKHSLDSFNAYNLFKQDPWVFAAALIKLGRAGAIDIHAATIHLTKPIGGALCRKALQKLGKL